MNGNVSKESEKDMKLNTVCAIVAPELWLKTIRPCDHVRGVFAYPRIHDA